MQLTIARKLVRLILIVLAVQFISPAVTCTVDNESENLIYQAAFSDHSEKSVSLCILLSENEEKGKEEETKESFCLSELVNFSFVTSALTSSHSQVSYDPLGSSIGLRPALNQLCILTI